MQGCIGLEGGVWIGSLYQKQFQDFRIAVPSRVDERWPPNGVAVDVSPARDKQANDVDMRAALTGEMPLDFMLRYMRGARVKGKPLQNKEDVAEAN
jgi:hypothetical protein